MQTYRDIYYSFILRISGINEFLSDNKVSYKKTEMQLVTTGANSTGALGQW